MSTAFNRPLGEENAAKRAEKIGVDDDFIEGVARGYRRMKRGSGKAWVGVPALSVSPLMESRDRKLLEAVRAERKLTSELIRKNRAGTEVRLRGRRAGMDITWVTDRIGVGGGIWNAENMAAVSRAGITHIIDMQIEFDDTPLAAPHGIVVCWNPVDDDFEPKPPAVFARGVDFAVAALEEDGAKLFIHCAAGVHRAPMMTLALLGTMGWTLEDGMELIEGRRPVADFADVYVRSVEKFLRSEKARAIDPSDGAVGQKV